MGKSSERDQRLFGGNPTDGSIDLSRLVIPTAVLHKLLPRCYPKRPRYIVVHFERRTYVHDPDENDPNGPRDVIKPHVEIYGGDSRVNLFSTLRNAIREAVTESAIEHAALTGRIPPEEQLGGSCRVSGRRGAVLLFDPSCLPVVDLSDPGSLLINARHDELAFAERQLEWWGKRVQALLAKERTNNETEEIRDA